MNGADALVKTLRLNGVDTYFANPGTSEMHLVSSLAADDEVRAVLCLFEGVATGAADGYGRMAGKPAVTLLHLGPGLANGGANLHNAMKARTPVINVVGEHATHHRQFNTPLSSDIAGWAAQTAAWVATAETADEVGDLASQAVSAAMGAWGGQATLIIPADCAWTETELVGSSAAVSPLSPVDEKHILQVSAALSSAAKPVILLGGRALHADALTEAARLRNVAGAHAPIRIMSETFPARQARGRGRLAPDRMMYFAEQAVSDLQGVDLLVLIGAQEPIAFFAYPDKPSRLAPADCEIMALAQPGDDCVGALRTLADRLGAPTSHVPTQGGSPPPCPTGKVTALTVGDSVARHLPADAVVSDDGVTSSLPIYLKTTYTAPHEWLTLTGGAIGQGLPLAVGAAVACPDRKVLALSGDGAGLYTVQALWTMAREDLDITVLIFANDSYAILEIERARTGASSGQNSGSPLLSLGNPAIDWVSLGKGFGMNCSECDTADAFDAVFATAMTTKGPQLIVVRLRA